MGFTGVVDVFCAACAVIQAIAAVLFIWDWHSKRLAFGKKLFTVILAMAALVMAGFVVWLYDHPLKPTIIERTLTVEKTLPCPPTKSGGATTKGQNSPAITGSNNPVTYGQQAPAQSPQPK